jgi:hypothetical protein
VTAFLPRTMIRPISCLALLLLLFPTTSDARPATACAQACRRITSCKLLSFDLCMDMCGEQGADKTPAGRASTLAQSKMSCSALADQMSPGEWLCTAEGASSYGFGVTSGSTADDASGSQSIYMLGNGKTRGAAVYKAISSCNSIMTVQLNTQQSMQDSDYRGEWGAAVTSACHITQCIPPASARKKRLR